MVRKLSHWIDNRNAVVVILVLIVVPVALVVLRSFVFTGHGCALQNNAVANMRSLNTAMVMYETTYNAYPPSLAVLGPPLSGRPFNAQAAGYIDPKLASGNYVNYWFRYSLKEPLHRGGPPVGYVIVADPVVDQPGRRHYFTNEEAVVRSEELRPATAASPRSNEDGCVCW